MSSTTILPDDERVTESGLAVAVRPSSRWGRFLAVAGPGLVVMLADTDAGSIITAAQSGALWGYRLLVLQLVLIPILYVVQELTVRLGAVTGQGHAALIKRHFGSFWALVSVSTLLIACVGALLTELSGIAGVGQMLHIPMWASLTLAIVLLVVMVVTGSYRSVEGIAMGLGAFELAFLVVAILAKPSFSSIAHQAFDMPLLDPKYMLLISANIGAVIMPWMVFYQQSAVIEKGLTPSDLPMARLDTAVGSIVTQLVMAAVLVAAAATLSSHASVSLDTVPQIAEALTAVLGRNLGQLCFGLGVAGAAMVAAIVVTLTAARTLGEYLGYRHQLAYRLVEAPWFYGIYTLTLIAAGLIVLSGTNLITLSVGVQVLNAMLLPIVLGFLFLMARRLPEPYRLKGGAAWVVGLIMLLTVCLGLYSGFAGIFA